MFIPRGFTQRSVDTALGRIVYYTNQAEPWAGGAFRRTLVFLHGLGGGSSAYEWSKLMPAFAAEHQILAPDLIGWGRSDHPARSYRAEDYIDSILEFLEKVARPPATVIASALTGAFTIRAAIRRPELFRSLTVINAAGLAEFGRDYRRSGFARFAQSISNPLLQRLLYAAGVANRQGIRQFLKQRQFADAAKIYPEIVEAYLQSAKQKDGHYAALSFVRGDLCFDLSAYIQDLKVPAAILWGRGSEYTSLATGRRLAELNPGAIRQFIALDDVGFTPQLEQPALTIGLLRKILASIDPAALSP